MAKHSELQFKKFLLRLIAIQLFENVNIPEKLAEAAYNLEESKIDSLLFVYTDSLTDIRSDERHMIVPSTALTLNFRRFIDDVNLLIYKDNDGTYHETSYLLPEISHIDKDERSLFDSFLETKVPNDVELTFYAMLLFLRAFPIAKTQKSDNEAIAWYFDRNSHESWLKNLEYWVRSSRNILLNDNNNQRIDKIQFSREATLSLKQMVTDMASFVQDKGLKVESDRTVVKQFLKSSDKTYQRLDNQSLAEERLKASLILENPNEWESELDKAEQHPYLWGQIRCLLNWADNNLASFKEYRSRLLQLLDCMKEDCLTYYTAILVFAPDCWEESNRLFEYNKDRDNSFKRYLREHTRKGQAYGADIKALIDIWMKSYSDSSAKEFLTSLVADNSKESTAWIQCIVKSHSVLDEAWNKRIYHHHDVTMAQRKTRDSHCFDPILVYLRNLCRDLKLDENKFKLYDSKGEYEHAFQLECNDHNYLVEWFGTDGHYSIKVDGQSQTEYSPKDMIVYMENIIKNTEQQKYKKMSYLNSVQNIFSGGGKKVDKLR